MPSKRVARAALTAGLPSVERHRTTSERRALSSRQRNPWSAAAQAKGKAEHYSVFQNAVARISAIVARTLLGSRGEPDKARPTQTKSGLLQKMRRAPESPPHRS